MEIRECLCKILHDTTQHMQRHIHELIFEEFGEYFAELLLCSRIIITFCYIMYNAIVLLIYEYLVFRILFLLTEPKKANPLS